MRILFSILISVMLFTSMIFSQEQTLLGGGKISHGGFGGPVLKYTQINGEPGLLIGGRGGWIINHAFVLGGGGYGLVNNIESNAPIVLFTGPYYERYINFGYGGVELEYIIQSDRLVHFSIYALIGAGGVSYMNEYPNDPGIWDSPSDAFFVFEPAVNAELNIISFMRICAGVSYRFISGAHLDNLTDSDLQGIATVITFKFGKF